VTDQEDRAAILAAMERLLAGTPLRSSGNLDIISLAEEAGLKRNKLTHKHTDLKDRFYAERRAREGMTDREAKLHDEIAQLKARIDELRQDRDNYRTANEVFARAFARPHDRERQPATEHQPIAQRTPHCHRPPVGTPG
jgi:chromosome segregation ATPase